MKRPILLSSLLRFLLPLALLLAQHGVWAHGFGHDAAAMAAHGQWEDHASATCCLPYQAAGDAVYGTPVVRHGEAAMAIAVGVPPAGDDAATLLPYRSRAPPLTS